MSRLERNYSKSRHGENRIPPDKGGSASCGAVSGGLISLWLELPKERRKNGDRKKYVFEEIITLNFSNLMKSINHVPESSAHTKHKKQEESG